MIQKNEAFESDIRRQLKSYMDSKDWGVFLTWNATSYIQSMNYLLGSNVGAETLRMIALPLNGWPVVMIAAPQKYLPEGFDNSKMVVLSEVTDSDAERITEALDFWINNPVRFKG
jgi:hypothetical protein